MNFIRNYFDEVVSALFFILAFAMSVFILSWDQHRWEIESLVVFFIKLIPFFFALVSIIYFPAKRIKAPLNILLIISLFGAIFCYFIAELIRVFWDREFEAFYLLLQMLTPFIILALALSFKLGGAAKREVGVFGICCLLFMLSGIEDLAACLLRIRAYADYTMPEIWDWAQHMTVFFGRPATKYEAYVFISIHFVLIGVILVAVYSRIDLVNKFSHLIRQNKYLPAKSSSDYSN